MHALIEADGLTKCFGKVQALSELSLTLPPGEPVAILGPNGAGKTTFIRMVATLLAPDRGTLRVGGHDVVEDSMAVRRMIGLAGQSAAVEEMMTGRENLVMVARLYGRGRKQAVTGAEQHPRAHGPDRRGGPAREDVLGRHAPAPRPRGQPRRESPAAAARRADDGARSREPARGVGRRARDERGRDRRGADDAVSRRGRPSGGHHRHHRRRPRHRPGDAERAEVPGGCGRDRAAHRRRGDDGARRVGSPRASYRRGNRRTGDGPGDAPVLAGRTGWSEVAAARRAGARRRGSGGGGHLATATHVGRGVPRADGEDGGETAHGRHGSHGHAGTTDAGTKEDAA